MKTNFFGFKIWQVTGHSMFPRIPQSSFVLVLQWFAFRKIKPGQTLLINHNRYGFLIKKVALIDKNGLIWCKGENPSSISIEKLGPIGKQNIIGQVLKVMNKVQRV